MSDLITKCPKCGKLLVNIVSGALCPGGCGGLHPRVPEQAQAKAMKEAKFASLPLATELEVRACKADLMFFSQALYSIEGEPGVWRRVPRTNKKNRKPGEIVARDGENSRVIQVRQDILANACLMPLFPMFDKAKVCGDMTDFTVVTRDEAGEIMKTFDSRQELVDYILGAKTGEETSDAGVAKE
jgi:hypothetical protein